MKNIFKNKREVRRLDFTEFFRLFKFAIVGSFGVLVNMFFLWFLTETFRVYYLISSVLAIEISIINNFTWNYLWTWSDRKEKTSRAILIRMVKYHISVVFAAVGNWILLGIFKEAFGMHYLVANVIGIAGGFILNYILGDRWVFK